MRPPSPRRMLLLVLLLAFPPRALSQEDGRLIILEHADSLVGMEVAGEPARHLMGNVLFRQGNVTVRCEQAIQYLRTNRVYFDGLVQVDEDSLRMVGQRALYYAENRTVEAFDRILLEDGTMTLQARYGTYSADERKAYFRDNVVIADTSSVLTAHEVRFDRNEKILHADGGVRVEDARRGAVSWSDHLENRRNEGYTLLTGRPRMLQADPEAGAGADTLFVSGLVIESFSDSSRRLVVTDSVKIFRDGLTGSAGLALFLPDEDRILLHRSPYLWYDDPGGEENQVTGDSVIVTLRDERADNVRVAGNATAVSEADLILGGRYNQLAGQEIIMYFDGKRLRSIDVHLTATSLYYLFEEGRPNGLNRSSGNAVRISFEGGKIASITISENAEGQYVPEQLVGGREGEYNLTGFQWREKRPARDW